MSKNKTAVYIKGDGGFNVKLNKGDACLVIRANEDVELYLAGEDDNGMLNGSSTAINALGLIASDDAKVNEIIEEFFSED